MLSLSFDYQMDLSFSKTYMENVDYRGKENLLGFYRRILSSNFATVKVWNMW